MTVSEVVALGLLGGVLGLDTVSFPQAMISRPIVACTVAGAFLGSAMAGLLLGALVESFALETLPVGASRYPEWGGASAVGGALVARSPDWHEGTIAIALVATLATAWFGGWSMVQLRRWNGAQAQRRQAQVNIGDRDVVAGLQVRGLAADLLRGILVTVLGIVVFSPLATLALARWSLDPLLTRMILVTVGGIMAVSAVYKVFHGVAHTRWFFAAGLTAGLLYLGVA